LQNELGSARTLLRFRSLAFALSVACLALVLTACGGGDDSGSGGGDSLVGLNSDMISTLTGSKTITEEITIEEGMLLMHAESDGGHFAVNLVQETGNEVLFNETVKYSGSNAVRIFDRKNPIGQYLAPGPATLEITSSSKWSISYSQEELTSGQSSNLDISGELDYVLPAINLQEGTYTLTASNDVEFGHFSVKLLNRNDSGHMLIVNKSNPDNETFEFEINASSHVINPAGLWTLVIQSTGKWDVKIE